MFANFNQKVHGRMGGRSVSQNRPLNSDDKNLMADIVAGRD